VWKRPSLAGAYDTRTLKPVETVLLLRYKEELGGSAFELGCGAGRITGYLDLLADDLHAIDVSPAMIERASQSYPDISFRTGNIAHERTWAGSSWDSVIALNNVLDYLDFEDRLATLSYAARSLKPGKLLLMSSHNRAYGPNIPRPWDLRGQRGAGLLRSVIRMPYSVRNWRRNRPHTYETARHAIYNDIAHDYSLLHVYVTQSEQRRELQEAGLEVVECLDPLGVRLAEDDDAPMAPELHYVARRPA
jgi:SAM-dependent methyltransferase